MLRPHKDTYVLMYIQTKTRLLGPFKKLNCLNDLIYITTTLNAIHLPKYKRPRGEVQTRISLTMTFVRAQISITLPQK